MTLRFIGCGSWSEDDGPVSAPSRGMLSESAEVKVKDDNLSLALEMKVGK